MNIVVKAGIFEGYVNTSATKLINFKVFVFYEMKRGGDSRV
jgi:hypothetical protein